MKRITIRDVAKEAGVSVTLVSFVLNAKRREDGRLDCPVNPQTAERVFAAATKLGYRKNAAAASLRSGRSNSIAVLTTDISNKFFAGIARHIEDTAAANGYSVIFGSTDGREDRFANFIDTVLSYNIDGLIVAPVKGAESLIQRIINAKIPVVLLDRDVPELEGDFGKVILDNQLAGQMATEFLIGKGYRNIEMVSYSHEIYSISEREKGYVKTMEENGLADRIRVNQTTYANIKEDISRIIDEALARGANAFFAPTYSIAAAVLTQVKAKGLRMPEDLAVVGFDNSNIYNLFASDVAHIIQPLKELGELSTQLVLDMIEGKDIKEKTIILKPTLV